MDKLHFDGHGINNEKGERVAKVTLRQWREDGRGLDPEFEKLSNLLASAPDLERAIFVVYSRVVNTNINTPIGDMADTWDILRKALAGES